MLIRYGPNTFENKTISSFLTYAHKCLYEEAKKIFTTLLQKVNKNECL